MSADDFQERLDAEVDAQADQTAMAAAMQTATEHQQETLFNPNFFDELRDSDVDGDLYDWLEAELGPVFSGAHIVGYRDEHYPQQRDLLNRNAAERIIAERSPGRHLRQHPKLNALAQGLAGTSEYPNPTDNPAYRAPLTQAKKRVIRAAMEVATTQQSLATQGYGLDSVTTATAEHRTVNRDSESGRGMVGRATEVFR
jgi:hypothetical protein